MSEDQMDYILGQTGITTMFVTAALLPKFMTLAKNNKHAGVHKIVLMHNEETEEYEQLRNMSYEVNLW